MIPRLRKAWGESTQLFEAMNDLGKVKLTDQLPGNAGGRHVSVSDGGHGDEGPPHRRRDAGEQGLLHVLKTDEAKSGVTLRENENQGGQSEMTFSAK